MSEELKGMKEHEMKFYVYLKNGNIIDIGSSSDQTEVDEIIANIWNRGVYNTIDLGNNTYQKSYYPPSSILKITQIGECQSDENNIPEKVTLRIYENDEFIDSYEVLGMFKAREHAGAISGEGYRYVEEGQMNYISRNGNLRVVFDDPRDKMSTDYESKETENENTD